MVSGGFTFLMFWFSLVFYVINLKFYFLRGPNLLSMGFVDYFSKPI